MLLKTLSEKGSWVTGIDYSSKGDTIATAYKDGAAELLDSNNGKIVRTLQKNGEPLLGVRFSLDGTMIAAASNDKTVKLWKTDGSLLKPLSGHEGTIRRVA